jgi:hypothetical protein
LLVGPHGDLTVGQLRAGLAMLVGEAANGRLPGGDVLTKLRNLLLRFVDLPLEHGDVGEQQPQFAAPRNQASSAATRADDQRAVGFQPLAAAGDEAAIDDAFVSQPHGVGQRFDEPGVPQQLRQQRLEAGECRGQSIGAVDDTSATAEIELLTHRLEAYATGEQTDEQDAAFGFDIAA